MKDLTAYIDGDIIVYRCAFAAEKTEHCIPPGDTGKCFYFENYKEAKAYADANNLSKTAIWNRKLVQPVEFALQATKNTMEALIGRFKSYRVYLSGPVNFRTDVAVTRPYKGNRDRTKDPIYKKDVQEYLVREYGAESTVGIEADDSIGIALTADNAGCAVTIDKDLDQIAGWHYNWVSGESYNVSRQEADFNLYSQVLSGDATDNISGLEGVGPIKARSILDGSKSSRELAERVWSAYRSHFDEREGASTYFLEQLRLVFVLRTQEHGPNGALNYLPKGFAFD